MPATQRLGTAGMQTSCRSEAAGYLVGGISQPVAGQRQQDTLLGVSTNQWPVRGSIPPGWGVPTPSQRQHSSWLG
eukprot:364324-Chlamydomonas_euryale.AAC.6